MSLGCCRARRSPVQRNSSICDEFETSGAQTIVWPISTSSGMKLIVTTTVAGSGSKVDLFDYVHQLKCTGGTVKWLLRQKATILKALAERPTLFSPFLRTGMTLGQVGTLVRTR